MALRSNVGRRVALDLVVHACQTYVGDVEPSDGGSVFTVTVATEYGPLVPQKIQASSLVEALARAIAVPFPDWFPEEPDTGEEGGRRG